MYEYEYERMCVYAVFWKIKNNILYNMVMDEKE